MAKGSQLSQLKTALNKAGLTQQSQNGKKRKRAVLDDKEKERRATKLKEIQQKMNPFDVKVTKLKHDVGGRKIAGVMGRPAQSKQAGIEQVCESVMYILGLHTQMCFIISREKRLFSKSLKRRIAPEALSTVDSVKMTLP